MSDGLIDHIYMFDDDHTINKIQISAMTASLWKQFHKTKQVLCDYGKNGRMLSTVLLAWPCEGTNAEGDQVDDCLFESILFPGEEDDFDEIVWRYRTYDESVEGHNILKDLLNKVKEISRIARSYQLGGQLDHIIPTIELETSDYIIYGRTNKNSALYAFECKNHELGDRKISWYQEDVIRRYCVLCDKYYN